MSTIDTLQPVQPVQLDTSKASGDLYDALAKAQADVESVGKDGTNTQRGYRYATTEAMIRGSRQHLAGHGLAFFSTWSQALPIVATGDIGKQHVAAMVTIHWVLGHATGGQVSGTAHMDAIGSPARPPDKAVAAAVTYGLGFVLRGILLLDRAVEDEHAPDRRPEPEPKADPIWEAYEAARDAHAQRRGISRDQAHAEIREAAGVTYDDQPTDAQVQAMTAAAQRKPKAPEPAPTAEPEPAAKTRAKPKASKPPTDVAAVEAHAHWLAAGAALVNYRVADYHTAHGVAPSKELVTIFRSDAMGISERGIGVEPGAFPKSDGTAEQYRLAAAQLREALKMRQQVAGGAR
jgi:hypothetical protein